MLVQKNKEKQSQRYNMEKKQCVYSVNKAKKNKKKLGTVIFAILFGVAGGA